MSLELDIYGNEEAEYPCNQIIILSEPSKLTETKVL